MVITVCLGVFDITCKEGMKPRHACTCLMYTNSVYRPYVHVFIRICYVIAIEGTKHST